VEGGGWRVEGGGWRAEGGGWRVEDGEVIEFSNDVSRHLLAYKKVYKALARGELEAANFSSDGYHTCDELLPTTEIEPFREMVKNAAKEEWIMTKLERYGVLRICGFAEFCGVQVFRSRLVFRFLNLYSDCYHICDERLPTAEI
jgi:hypothetical protein